MIYDGEFNGLAEFLAIYGRRRVGKTYLIKKFFQNKGCYYFQIIGINAISTHSVVYIAELLLVAYGALWTLAKMIEQLRLLAMNRVVERDIRLLTLDIFDNLTKLSLRYHSDRKTGAIISAVDRAQYACPGLIWGVTFFIIPTLLEIVFEAIVLIYLYGVVYGLILAAILIIFISFTLYATTWSGSALRIANEKASQATTKIVDSILNYETIRYFGNQKLNMSYKII